MGQPSPPSAPNYAQQYAQGIKVYLKNLPTMLQKEQEARAQYDPQRIEEQQTLQDKYGPTQYAQELAAWKQLDPHGYGLRQTLGDKIQGILNQGGVNPLQTAGYNQLGQGVEGQYARGTQADPETLRQISQAVRSRQGQDTAGGNAQGMAEAVYVGQRGQQLQQQRTGNLQGFLGIQTPQEKAIAQAGSYLSLPSAMSQMNQIQGVSPDRASAYVNPTAGAQGAQFGLQNYANQLGQYQAGGGSTNPWQSALGGAASGAAAGTAISPGYGTAIGGIIGGLGGYFSSIKLKKDIVKVGEHNGLDIIEFRYRAPVSALFRGVIAEQVQQLYPEAVTMREGFLAVNYDLIGIPFEKRCAKCGQFKNINDFYPDQRRGTHRSDCKLCGNAAAVKWNHANLDRKKLANQRRREKQRQYEQKKWRSDPVYKLKCRLRWFLRQHVKAETRTARARELLGCTVEEFKAYIQYQFKDGMAWNNYGKWHIDHIRPCSSFDLFDPEQQRQCFHFSNMQPLWAHENREKWHRWQPEQEVN